MDDYRFKHRELINESIQALYCNLGNAKIMTFMSDFKNPELMINFREDATHVEQLAMVIAKYYGLSVGSISVGFKDMGDKAAQIMQLTSHSCHIDIDSEKVENSNELLAILAHEMTHSFLDSIHLSFNDTIKNEILTDTTAAYLGLGNLILNAHSIRIKKINGNTSSISYKLFGYLKSDEFGYVLAKRAKKFDNDPVPFLVSEARSAYRTGLSALNAEYKQLPLDCGTHWSDKLIYKWHRMCAAREAKKNGTYDKDYKHLGYKIEVRDRVVYIIFRCRLCLQLLRIPAFRSLISVHCPRCESIYTCKT